MELKTHNNPNLKEFPGAQVERTGQTGQTEKYQLRKMFHNSIKPSCMVISANMNMEIKNLIKTEKSSKKRSTLIVKYISGKY